MNDLITFFDVYERFSTQVDEIAADYFERLRILNKKLEKSIVSDRYLKTQALKLATLPCPTETEIPIGMVGIDNGRIEYMYYANDVDAGGTWLFSFFTDYCFMTDIEKDAFFDGVERATLARFEKIYENILRKSKDAEAGRAARIAARRERRQANGD